MTRPRPSFPQIALLVVLAGMLLSACAGSQPAAVVGPEEVTQDELHRDIVFYGFLAALSDAPCGNALPGETTESACARFTLANDVREELVKAYAAEHDLAVSDTDVTNALAQLEANVGGPEVLDAQLDELGVTRPDLRTLARRLLLFNQVQTSVVQERLGDDALQELYQQQIPRFTTLEVSHILVPDQATAEQIAAEATPENFAALAQQHSTDTASVPAGGSLGSFSEEQFRANFDPTFVDAALALEPGQISAPVQTPFGWHVIMLVRRDLASFDDVKDQLRATQSSGVFAAWLIERLQATDVEVDPRYGKLDEETGAILPVRSTAEEPELPAEPSAEPTATP